MSASTTAFATRPRRWPWVAFSGFTVVAALGTWLVAVNDESVAAQVPYIVAFAMFGLVGALIASRDPHNTIGVLLLYTSCVTAFSFVSGELVTFVLEGGSSPGWLVPIALLNNFGWLFGVLPSLFLLPLLFPDGKLPSPRWRPYLWFIYGFLVFLALSLMLGQETLTGSGDVGIPNPLYVAGIGNLPNLDPVINILFPLMVATSIASLFGRFRRSKGVERQQIKWVGYGLLVALIGVTLSGSDDTILQAIIGGIGFIAFPLSIGIAVLRFHLYDLDVVVRKTVVYAAIALFATAVYLALVVGLGAWLGRGSSFLTMVAAVLVAVTFQPIRAWFTRFANRVVYGKRATPYEVLTEFSERVGSAYADEDVLPRMARVLGEGVGADRADVWLAIDRELRDVAVWPADSAPMEPIALANGTVPPLVGTDRVYAVEQAGELLGALAIAKPASDPVSPADDKLIADLAAQAGLVLRNVRLTEDLKARLAELKAAQRRIVHAQDHERRRLERNIHDGAQQQLVALSVKLRLADGLVERDAEQARALLGQIGEDTQTVLEDLRDLARGIYPPLLADRGLPAALEAQARKVEVPVEVRADGIGRFDQEIEAAVYFSCLEALQNVAKYADASAVTIALARTDGVLAFTVADDGRGFDPAATSAGTGLRGIADRLTALDGSLEVESALGRGTTIAGRIPATERAEVSA